MASPNARLILKEAIRRETVVWNLMNVLTFIYAYSFKYSFKNNIQKIYFSVKVMFSQH